MPLNFDKNYKTTPDVIFVSIFLCSVIISLLYTTKKTKISEGYLVRENVKSLSHSVIKFCDQGICEEFHFFRH